jgi:RNA polymerase sigma factor (sigma-70 family)
MTEQSEADAATSVFVGHRELLFSVVYNLLGSVADTEDVLQETWVSWSRRHAQSSSIENPRAYLVRIAVNEALARQASITRRRESYVGPWLPEPLLTDSAEEDPAVRSESVSMALLVVLETLSPLERAVYVLHEAFGYGYPEIGRIIGRSAPAARQLGHRAREHVRARRPRYEPDPGVRRAVTERFLKACLDGDLATLLEVLAPDVTLWADSGGRVPAPRHPIHGADQVAQFFAATSVKIPHGAGIREVEANGGPAALIVLDDVPYAVFVLDLSPEDHRVSAIRVVGNPAKLTGVLPGGGV